MLSIPPLPATAQFHKTLEVSRKMEIQPPPQCNDPEVSSRKRVTKIKNNNTTRFWKKKGKAN
jgi:hypothetical protein